MAVIHPNDHYSPSARQTRKPSGKLHPCFGLVIGFGAIFAATGVVHLLFQIL